MYNDPQKTRSGCFVSALKVTLDYSSKVFFTLNEIPAKERDTYIILQLRYLYKHLIPKPIVTTIIDTNLNEHQKYKVINNIKTSGKLNSCVHQGSLVVSNRNRLI